MPNIVEFLKILGVSFKRPALLEQALVHSSYINENPDYTLGHNERLEFLGDAVLNYIVADKLYREFPDLSEGRMTRLRAVLVRGDTLAKIARNIRLGDFLFMGKGEESTGGRNKTPNLAGALEAVIAAVYLDLGTRATTKMVHGLMAEDWQKLTSAEADIDYKSKLQEFTQSKHQSIPVYRLVTETGPDHDKVFKIEVFVNNKALATAKGKSKKMAETEAARLALQKLADDFTE